MIENNKKFDYRHIICIALTLYFVYLLLTTYSDGIFRFIESCRDFGLSVAYYFCELFEIERGFDATVNDYSNISVIKEIFFPVVDVPSVPTVPIEPIPSVPVAPSNPEVIIPDTYEGFQSKWTLYWQLFVSQDNLIAYIVLLSNILLYISYFLTLVLPLILLGVFLFKKSFNKQNNNYNVDTKALVRWKKIENKGIRPVFNWLRGMIEFVKTRRIYLVFWVIIWCFNFNLFSIFIEFLAFYFYFVFSFDFIHIYKQVYKLFVDLIPMFKTVPVFVWVIIALKIFDNFRKNIALSRLHHFEMRDRGFINARPIVTMVCGTMGKKKTTMITDMALSKEAMFRDKLFELLLKNDLKFPNFPFINLENMLKEAMERGIVYNLASCEFFIRYLRDCFMRYYGFDKATRKSIKRHNRKYAQLYNPYIDEAFDVGFCFKYDEYIFDYDFRRYGVYYDDKLALLDIWELIETYSKLYFAYIIQSSLMISNYSIRTDAMLADVGNFPMWNTDFFNSDSRLIDSYSRHSHILDFDILRLGKKVVEDNKYADNLEIGVYVVTEIGKERGNNPENLGKKKTDINANQKNDLFNYTLKMIRHCATIDKYPFVSFITDEQRPESWGQDARDLCDIVHIKDTEDTCLAMPFFAFGELIYGAVYGKLSSLYLKYRFNRGDNCLLMYFLKNILSFVNNYYTRIYNRFGFSVLNVQVENGTQDGKIVDGKYYLINKKIYSKRFSTDAFSDFFTNKSLHSKYGINDLPEYETERASLDELKSQNSYFVNDLCHIKNFDDEIEN